MVTAARRPASLLYAQDIYASSPAGILPGGAAFKAPRAESLILFQLTLDQTDCCAKLYVYEETGTKNLFV